MEGEKPPKEAASSEDRERIDVDKGIVQDERRREKEKP